MGVAGASIVRNEMRFNAVQRNASQPPSSEQMRANHKQPFDNNNKPPAFIQTPSAGPLIVRRRRLGRRAQLSSGSKLLEVGAKGGERQ